VNASPSSGKLTQLQCTTSAARHVVLDNTHLAAQKVAKRNLASPPSYRTSSHPPTATIFRLSVATDARQCTAQANTFYHFISHCFCCSIKPRASAHFQRLTDINTPKASPRCPRRPDPLPRSSKDHLHQEVQTASSRPRPPTEDDALRLSLVLKGNSHTVMLRRLSISPLLFHQTHLPGGKTQTSSRNLDQARFAPRSKRASVPVMDLPLWPISRKTPAHVVSLIRRLP
jgi:hypothetical protein